MNYLSLVGLVLDIVGAYLLIRGELRQHSAMLNYWTSGEQKDDYQKRIKSLSWWKRQPITLGARFGNVQQMGAESDTDKFVVKFWGLTLLILGFFFQALGIIFSP